MTSPRDPTQFTRESAERIANVVRAVELAPRAARPLAFDSVVTPRGRVFRVCTFTGAWNIDTEKTVTFKFQTTAPNTVSAINLFASIDTSAGDPRNCAIAKDGTAWFLIAAECP